MKNLFDTLNKNIVRELPDVTVERFCSVENVISDIMDFAYKDARFMAMLLTPVVSEMADNISADCKKEFERRAAENKSDKSENDYTDTLFDLLNNLEEILKTTEEK